MGAYETTFDQVNVKSVKVGGKDTADPTLVLDTFEDFMTSTQINYQRQARAGGGSGQSWAPDDGADVQLPAAAGVIKANHGTGPTSACNLVGLSPAIYYGVLGKGIAFSHTIRYQLANLSSAGNRYETFDGFMDSHTTDPEFNYGIFFHYTDNVNGGRWQAICRSAAGVQTVVDTGIAPVAGQWYVLRVEINEDADEANFYIDDDLVATITDNIISGDANPYTAESCTNRSTGTTNFVSRKVDYIRLHGTAGLPSRL